jgi:hypothetical protein
MNEMVERVARTLLAKLLAEDAGYSLAQGDDPTDVTLDGSFDLVDLVAVAVVEIEKTHTLTPKVVRIPHEGMVS